MKDREKMQVNVSVQVMPFGHVRLTAPLAAPTVADKPAAETEALRYVVPMGTGLGACLGEPTWHTEHNTSVPLCIMRSV